MKILLLEDDEMLSQLIKQKLAITYHVDLAQDGESALDLASANHYDMFLFDVNVPKIDGFELLSILRQAKNETPAIFITAKTSPVELKKGFDVGAHDYIRKPFDFLELEARMQRLLSNQSSKVMLSHNISLEDRTLTIDMQKINLTQKEANMLLFLAKHKNEYVSYEKFCANLWTLDEYPSEATMRTYIKNLRKILGAQTISSMRGIGWKLDII